MNFLLLRITRIIKETEDTKSFFLSATDGRTIHYQAGQFITLIFQHGSKEIRRSYSLGSCPDVDEDIFITVKRKTNGEISRYLFDHCKEGHLLAVLSPAGRFTTKEKDTVMNYFIAAGSGIVPVYSLIKEISYKRDSDIVLVYQCRSENEVIYKNGLALLQEKFPARLKIHMFYSRPYSHHIAPAHINNVKLENLILKEQQQISAPGAHYYLCGPRSFMRMAEFTLRLIGVEEENIHKEQFVIDPPPPPPLISDRSLKNITIHKDKNIFHLQAAYPQTILDAALANGIELPYSCKGASCSTCTVICTSGKVVMSMNEVLTQKDLNEGLVLTCVGYAATDIEITVPGNST